ncbi:MAG: hypothetical protein ACI4I6_06530 [Hominimerdicola sp.]
MDLKELDSIANSEEAISYNLTLIDYGYCCKMRSLYNEYKSGRMDIADCKVKKQQLVKEYRELSAELEYNLNLHKEYQENIKKSDILRSEISKSDDIPEIADLAVKAISLMTGDTVVYRQFTEKFKGSEK